MLLNDNLAVEGMLGHGSAMIIIKKAVLSTAL
ncbi:hypothetical protein VTH8203_03925 [Vibrio thalassae]|uniref:Uncharacterized protein n=1 Tax=Vibrio thalassae TaxID=1243014 RepID=A0A240EQJ9_9VIBR|nr:hypothetical protein VTH8203_03925 [Vibrio thalassae]